MNSIIRFITNLENGISFKSFFEEIEKISQAYADNKSVSDTLDLVKYYIKKAGMASNYIQQEKNNQLFPGFDDKIVENRLDTPEKKELFSEWYSKIYAPMKRAELRKEIDILTGQIAKTQAGEERSFAGFEKQKTNIYGTPVDRTGVLDPTSEKHNEAMRDYLTNKPEEDWDTGDHIMAKQIGMGGDEKITPEKEEEAFNKSRKNMRSELASSHKGAFSKSTKNESHVMSYMTEQINKDKFSPRGSFRDRGIKKLSYHEWLIKNQ